MKLNRGILAVCLALFAGEARAHFLFVRIGPMAEGGRSAEVYFSEQAEAGDPKFIDKVAGTRLWIQTKPGIFAPLGTHKAADRLRASVPAGGSVGVVGLCEYGVLARPGQTPFLLRYYPKAVAGKPDEVNQLKPLGASGMLEVVAEFLPGRIRLSAVRDGKPMPGAVFTTVDQDLTNSECKADASGWAVWTPSSSGRYSVYVKDVIKSPGTFNKQNYDEVREFATLAFNWPLDRTDADPEAVALFEKALASRAVWTDFPGFTADVAGEIDGRAYAGKVTVAKDGTVKAEVDDHVARPWLEDQLGSIAMHRMADDDRPKPILRFADDADDHALGRLLTFQGGRFASSYRVKDGQISVVNRHIGKFNMTINVIDNVPNAEGKFLPRSYLVHYWDAASGRLDRVETVTERWSRFGKIDLPASHTVATSTDTGLSVRSVTLSGQKIGEN